jgi:molybdate transport system regulatory protein
MKTSARNQFSGTASKIVLGAIHDEIELTVEGGHKIVAVVTHESARSLDLQVGAPAYALVKASSVLIVTDDAGVRFSARNRFHGKVATVKPGAVNTEVVIEMAEGGSVASMVTHARSGSGSPWVHRLRPSSRPAASSSPHRFKEVP